MVPIYIVSKGRHETRFTNRTLEGMGVDHYVVVEEKELELYASVIDRKRLLVLDPAYQRDYDTFDDLGDTKSKGPGAARNFAWDHAISLGARWHWVMDDNIRYFFRMHRNMKIPYADGTCFQVMQDFADRYQNLAMCGPNYHFFVIRKRDSKRHPALLFNSRIYSCNLIRNDVPFLSLRMLKAGWCTVQFNFCLQGKMATQTVKGGNTKEFYAGEGTRAKSLMQVEMHPDVSKFYERFGRAHHLVDYSPFRGNRLLLREGVEPPEVPNNYGLKLVDASENDRLATAMRRSTKHA